MTKTLEYLRLYFPSQVFLGKPSSPSFFIEAGKIRFHQAWFTDFLSLLAEQVGEQGFYPFHGALLEKQDNLFVFTGPSGVGKSFLAMGLANYGFRLVADDLFFCKLQQGTLSILPLPKKLRTASPKRPRYQWTPETLRQQSYPLEKIFLLFPKYAKETAVHSRDRDLECYMELTRANVFGCEGKTASQLQVQLNIRKAIWEKCPLYSVFYNDEEVSGAVDAIAALRN